MFKYAFILHILITILVLFGIQDVAAGNKQRFSKKMGFFETVDPQRLYNHWFEQKDSRKNGDSKTISFVNEASKGWIVVENETITSNISITVTQIGKPENPSRREEPCECKVYDKNIEVIRIKVASIFRNNLIKAFGYILHRDNMELDSTLYTSLYFILYTIKLNQVDILSMVSILSDLSFESSNTRFYKIFESLEKHLPAYLKGSATVWKNSIKEGKANLDVIFKPTQDGALVIDILEGMTKEVLDKVSESKDAEVPKNQKEKKIFYNFNMNILQIMRHVQKNREDINQIFFGALLEYFPRSMIQPNLEESIQVVIQYLIEVKLKDWDSDMGKISSDKAEIPYEIVQHGALKLIENKEVPDPVKDSLQIISTNLFDRNPTAANPNYASVSQIVSLDKIDIQFLLKYVGVGAFPDDVVICATRTSISLYKGYINYLTLMFRFNPYYYDSVAEILIALLTRAMKRQPDLAPEIVTSTGVVYSYLLFTHRYIGSPVLVPDDMQNINPLILGLTSPDIKDEIKISITKMIPILQESLFDYQKIIKEIPVYKCSTPVLCFIQLLVKLSTMKKLPKPEIMQYMPTIINSDCACGACPWEYNHDSLITVGAYDAVIRCDDEESTTIAIEPTARPTPTENTQPPPPSPTEGPVETLPTLKPTPATTPTAPPRSTIFGDVTPSPNLTTILPEKDSTDIVKIIKTISNDLPLDVKIVKGMLRVIEQKEMQAKLENAGLNKHSAYLPAIAAFMVHIEDLGSIELEDKQIETEFKKYLEMYVTTLKKVERVLIDISGEAVQPSHPIYASLLVAVEAPTTDEEKLKFGILKQVLGNQDIFKSIHGTVKNEDYKTTGTLLKTILKAMLANWEAFDLSEEQREVIEYYIPKVKSFGMAQAKVIYGVSVIQVSKNVQISDAMNNALDFKKLTRAQKINFNAIVNYLKKDKVVLPNWDKWIFYPTAGAFTTGLLKLLKSESSVTHEVKTAAESLSPLINLDGNGSKSVF